MGVCSICGGSDGDLSGHCINCGIFSMGVSGHGIGSAPASPYGNPYAPPDPGNQGASAAQQVTNAQYAAAAQQAYYTAAQQAAHNALANLQPLKSAGITVGELVGWRVWRLENGYLRSYSADYRWLPGHPARGEITDYGGGGIWAFKDPHRAHAKASGGLYVTGSVWLWGEIIEHADGYRGEYAAIRSLDAITVPDTAGVVEWPWERMSRQRAARREAQETLTELRERYLLQPPQHRGNLPGSAQPQAG
jgi:hypothetical protein